MSAFKYIAVVWTNSAISLAVGWSVGVFHVTTQCHEKHSFDVGSERYQCAKLERTYVTPKAKEQP